MPAMLRRHVVTAEDSQLVLASRLHWFDFKPSSSDVKGGRQDP
jgi:hypothetical protein